jgi:drug/metabolite transporter (DMT)-like permease
MVLAACGFAVMNACAKEVSSRLPFVEVAFFRSLFGTAAIVVWALFRGAPLAVKNRSLMLLRVVSGTVAMVLTFYALSSIPLGEASALLNLTPLFVAGVGWLWLRERVERAVGACLVLGMAGALLVFRPHGGSLGSGGLAAIGAAMTSALAMTSLRRLGETESPEAVVTAFAAFGSVITGAIAASSFVVPRPGDWLLLVLAGSAATVGQLSMTRAYAEDVAARVGGMNYLNIVASLGLGVVLFGEIPDPLALGGITAILLAGAGLVYTARRRALAPPVSKTGTPD